MTHLFLITMVSLAQSVAHSEHSIIVSHVYTCNPSIQKLKWKDGEFKASRGFRAKQG
jgi:hypothetical protein